MKFMALGGFDGPVVLAERIVSRPLDIITECRRIVERGTKPTLSEVRPIVDAWYARPENGAGGELHGILDDGNERDSDLTHHVMSDHYGEESKWICLVLLMLSRSQRRRL